MTRRFVQWSVVLGGLLSLLSSMASAQTGPEMFIAPWTSGQSVELLGSTSIFSNTHVKQTDESYQMSTVTALGRWRILGDRKESPVAGFEANYLGAETSNPSIPDHLIDNRLSIGSPLALINKEWFVIGIAGVGYAGNSYYSDGEAWYGMGTILVGKQFDKDRSLIFGIDYDGNRTFLPDVPLLGFAYRSLINPRLKYTVGVPFALIQWTPTDEWEIQVRYALLNRIEGSVDYHFTKHLTAFGRLVDSSRGYHLDNDQADRRIFFERKAWELGGRYSVNENIVFTAAVGYQFSQRFEYGFSMRNANVVAKPGDAGYLRVEAVLKF